MTDRNGGADEFDLFNPYPHSPGHRGVDTSIAAAADIAPKLGRLQAAAQCAIAAAGAAGLTADELAENLDVDRYTIQPRTSELKVKGIIADSRQRRLNASGKRAIVWTLPRYVRSEEGGQAHG